MKKLLIIFATGFISCFALIATEKDYKEINIYVNSIPKCGTHLLTKCVELLTDRPLIELSKNLVATDELPEKKNNEFFATHARYSQKAADVFHKYDYKTFLIFRDPRDRVVSYVHWIYKGGWNQRQIDNPLRKLPFDQFISHAIKRVKKEYDVFLPWLQDPCCCGVRFENLVGPYGGGTLNAQIEEIQKIAMHIHRPLNDQIVLYCLSNVFGGGPTFHKGQIGTWKEHFTEEHKAQFKKVAGQLLIDLGYETGFDW